MKIQSLESLIQVKQNCPRVNQILKTEDWRLLERTVCELFDKKGYDAYLTKKGADQGVDIIAEKFGEKIAIQCKLYKRGNNIPNREISHLEAGRVFYKCKTAIFITTSDYTQPAREMAAATSVALWTSSELETELESQFPNPKANEISQLEYELEQTKRLYWETMAMSISEAILRLEDRHNAEERKIAS